jgi:hypothetical protein
VKRRLPTILAAVILITGLGAAVTHHAQAATTTETMRTTASTTFAATAAAATSGPITGYEGLCLDDRGASTADFNPIDV